MRILLDVHPLIRCGPEPIITTSLLQLKRMYERNPKQLYAAGIYPNVYNRAIAAYFSEIIINMGQSAKYLCHKQPFTFYYLNYLNEIFINAKFIHMRTGYNRNSSLELSNFHYYQNNNKNNNMMYEYLFKRAVNPIYVSDKPYLAFEYWEVITRKMLEDCIQIGPSRCLTIRYEDLILNTLEETKKVFRFLNLPWDPIILKHETVIHKISSLSPYEASSKQVINKINRNSLLSWSYNKSILPRQLIEKVHLQSKLLHRLGYSQLGFPPNYSLLKPFEQNILK
uniref:Protein-tyrosine sulfotransferase n=1 Tax=Schistosoma haematobium TaxID=6185 RepID=A0A095B0X5_SCHHA